MLYLLLLTHWHKRTNKNSFRPAKEWKFSNKLSIIDSLCSFEPKPCKLSNRVLWMNERKCISQLNWTDGHFWMKVHTIHAVLHCVYECIDRQQMYTYRVSVEDCIQPTTNCSVCDAEKKITMSLEYINVYICWTHCDTENGTHIVYK